MSLSKSVATFFLLLSLLSPLSAGEAALRQALTPVLAALPGGAEVGVAVYDMANSRMLFTHKATADFHLASVTKLPVAAAALLSLGPDYQFYTDLVDLGNGIHEQRIAGLGVIARGDPCLDGHHSDGEPDRIFQEWAQALLDQGIRHIDGDLVIDSSFFSGPIRPLSYPGGMRNIQAWYSAPASAFAWNNNCIGVQVQPTQVGQPVRVLIRPHSPRIRVLNRASTQVEQLSQGLMVSRAANANDIQVSGRYQHASSWFPLAIHEDPDLLAGDHLAHVLSLAGIHINGSVRLAPIPVDAPLLHRHSSPLLSALRILNQRSQNFYGEQILRIIGQQERQEGSIEAGSRAIIDVLVEHLGLSRQGIQLVDGSGLSYDNRGSPQWIIDFLAGMQEQDSIEHFRASMREQWVKGQRCQVKTGSLAVARCLAGYIRIAGTHDYAFAILLNRGETRSISWANAARQQILETIVQGLIE